MRYRVAFQSGAQIRCSAQPQSEEARSECIGLSRRNAGEGSPGRKLVRAKAAQTNVALRTSRLDQTAPHPIQTAPGWRTFRVSTGNLLDLSMFMQCQNIPTNFSDICWTILQSAGAFMN